MEDWLNFKDDDELFTDETETVPSGTVVTNPKCSSFIRLNPYVSSTKKAMEVMGRICSAKPSDFIKHWMQELNEILFSEEKDNSHREDAHHSRDIKKYFFAKRNLFHNQDFIFNLNRLLKSLLLGMDRQMRRPSPKATLISVGGTFNAGKSTFLNFIVGRKNLLPVDTIPATMVPAFLYCGNFANDVLVSGVNNLGAIVSLDEDILNCVSHSTKGGEITASQIAATLQHFIVQLNNEYFKDYVFIDTPGYDNTEDGLSRLNTDEMLADKYLSMGDVVLWLIPIINGSLKNDDIDRLVKLGGDDYTDDGNLKEHSLSFRPRKIIVLLTKADFLKDPKSREEVFDEVCKCVQDMPNIVDVATLSAFNEKKWTETWHSRSGNDFMTMLENAVSLVPLHHETNNEIAKIISLFNSELSITENKIKDLQDLRDKARDSYLKIIPERNEIKTKWDKFSKKYKYLDTEVKNLVYSQFNEKLKTLDGQYKGEQEKEKKIETAIEQLNMHCYLIARWELNLIDWFRSQSILEYSDDIDTVYGGKTNKTCNDSIDAIKVYFRLSKKYKKVNAYIHYWRDDYTTIWPGMAMTFVTSCAGNNIWNFNLPKWAKGMVFAVVDEDCNVISQSIDFTDDDIRDGFVYYRSKIGKPYNKNGKEKKQCKSFNTSPGIEREKSNEEQSINYIFKLIESHNFDGLLNSLSNDCDITGMYNNEGMSVVTAAAHYGFRKAIELFVNFSGVEILNIADQRGYNALHSAAAALKFETFRDIVRMDSTLKDIATLDGKTFKDCIPEIYHTLIKTL